MRGRFKLFKVYLGIVPFVVVYTPESAEALLKSTTVLNKSFIYKLLNFWLGTGLLTSKRTKWRGRRKLLTPAFHFKLLDDFLPAMAEHALELVHKLRALPPGPVDIVPFMSNLTLDIICETAMGVKIGAIQDEGTPYVKAVKVVSGSFLARVVRPYFWRDSIFYLTETGREIKKNVEFLHKFTTEIIHARKKEYMQGISTIETNYTNTIGRKRRTAFLDTLVSYHLENPAFTENGIREEVDTFMFEGHDTTAMGISFTLYLLGLHKDVQDMVVKELQSIFNDDDRLPTVEDLKQMKYLECVIKESHRLYPPVPIIGRDIEEDMEFDGYMLPKGCTVNLFIYCLHRNETWFPKPEEFRPERFLPENSAARHPYAYVPFSAGSRNCIGQRFALQEEKTAISTILRHFSLHSPDTRETVLLIWELVLRPVNGLRVQFTPRKCL
ncbi:cytochrome P450 4C1-like isoform X2 [Ornithodoros turicata]